MGSSRSRGSQVPGWKAIYDKVQMKASLDRNPLIGIVEVHQSFINYLSGIYHCLGDFDSVVGVTCVSVEGYDDSIKAWRVRTSFGEGWGEAGCAWIAYDDSLISNVMYEIPGHTEIEHLNALLREKELELRREKDLNAKYVDTIKDLTSATRILAIGLQDEWTKTSED